jgi:hypothetical protein
MKNLVINYLPLAIIGTLMLSIVAFIGGIVGFGFTEDTTYLAVCIGGMHGIFASIVFGMFALFIIE